MGNGERCIVCGEETPAIYLTRGVCEDCRLASWLPKDYPKLEWYQFVEVFGHANATRTPKTGVDFLDRHLPRFYEFQPPVYDKEARRKDEAAIMGAIKCLAKWLGYE